ncbi:sugar ABC transporter permease [Sulfitobacter sp. SK012]|uniref:ABC transporter permease n=1 Tax=Sulfitobacter sp. SK012 TaxID=1389005 RepID=UPI000E0A6CA4|nr:ABC transporter permease [Sulfitobacter sp. SK012]AXI48016.1 sugar ABC transporter permease [Sulfitobacter sp. SK012]
MTYSPQDIEPAQRPANAFGGGRNMRFASFRCISALILREMSTRYGRSPGGYVWAILEPLGAILVLAMGFSLLLRTPSLGTSFLLFYATGYLPFQLYSNLASLIARSINFSRALLSYPAVSWLDTVLARFLLNSMTSVLVAYILLAGILFFTDARTTLEVTPIIWSMGLAMLLGLGMGTLNCVVGGLWPVWDTIWGIAMRPLMIASGVLFLYEDLPTAAQNILWYNPLMHVTGLMRQGFYPTYTASYVSEIFVLMTGVASLTLGLILMRRYHRALLER